MSDMAENMKQAKSAQDIVAVNKPTLQQAVKQYKKSPFSLFLRVIVTLAAVITVSVLLFFGGLHRHHGCAKPEARPVFSGIHQ